MLNHTLFTRTNHFNLSTAKVLDSHLARSHSVGVGIVSGWGISDNSQPSDRLLWVEVPIMDDEFCREFLGGIIIDSMLCAGYEEGGKDACNVSNQAVNNYMHNSIS